MSFYLKKGFAAGRFALLMCIGFVFAITTAQAQTKKIVLPRQQVTVSELFGEIRRQTGATVVFDEDSISPAQTVTLLARQGTATELLAQALPGNTVQMVDNYVVVQPAEPKKQAIVAISQPQPTRAEFERNVHDYTSRNLAAEPQERTIIRYDTIRTELPHSGVFAYPAQTITPNKTGRAARTPFTRDTPPVLAVKTNLLWWAARGTLNIAGEVGLGKRTSLELAAGLNRWNLEGSDANNKKLAHWVVKPEFRYWLCERFNGHFFGLHAFYGQYNVGGYDVPLLFKKEYRYDGYAYGAGINYGYHLPLAKRWGMEFTVGVGVMQMDYTRYDCVKCGNKSGHFQKTYFGPTELGVKLIFMIK